jgi:hypothetical protein
VARRKNRKLRKWVYWMRLRSWWWIYSKFIVGKPQSSHLTYFFMRSLPIGVWCAFDDSKWLCVEEMWQKITNSSQIQKTTSCLDLIMFVFLPEFCRKSFKYSIASVDFEVDWKRSVHTEIHIVFLVCESHHLRECLFCLVANKCIRCLPLFSFFFPKKKNKLVEHVMSRVVWYWFLCQS